MKRPGWWRARALQAARLDGFGGLRGDDGLLHLDIGANGFGGLHVLAALEFAPGDFVGGAKHGGWRVSAVRFHAGICIEAKG